VRACPHLIKYPERAGAGIAVPAHHHFPNYLKLLRLGNGRLRLIVDVPGSIKEKTVIFSAFLAA
jgi:hypothetical protein